MDRPFRSTVRAGALAVVGGRLCTDLVDITSDLAALDSSGFWAVVLPFEGEPCCGRFATVQPARPWPGAPWKGPAPHDWTTSLDRNGFERAVGGIRSEIAAGEVYQVNLTRRLRAPLDRPGRPRQRFDTHAGSDIAALGAALAQGNPAPYSAVVRIPAAGIAVASASPELFLARDGNRVRSSPIKGTAATPEGFLDKDRAENVMIVDLVRNDLGRVCEWGSVIVPTLFGVEAHPGLFHLVSTVEGTLRPGHGWAESIDATFPPGSVTGAPKLAALESIHRHEPEDRGLYCGAIGWVDADRTAGALNVAIRTFWITDDELNFGTGGAITWDSDPGGEWAETELKASNLLSVASAPATTPRESRS
ncbi:MAG: anthranilate synthase component I family protein [Microthrixaceae bacterium]|nr:anthranilate synthase component I family protein [Microthrixaceae bacterium]